MALLVLGAASGVAWWYVATTPTTKRRPRERRPTPVQVAVARVAAHPITLDAHGSVVPSRTVELRPQVRGEVISVHDGLVPGSVLPAGAVLAQVDPRDYQLEVDRLASELISAESALRLEEGNQAIAKREYELLGELGKDGDPSLVLRKPQLAAARAAVQVAQSRLAAAKLQLARTRITVPFDAVILSTQVALGAQVTESSVLAECAGIDTWWVEVTLPASDLRWVRRFERATGALPVARVADPAAWEPGATRPGRVARIAAGLQAEGRLARLFVAVADPLARTDGTGGTPRLLLDAWMRVELPVGAVEEAVALAPSWLRDGTSVWVCTAEGTLAVRTVAVAYRDRDRVLVTAGLQDGEQVITSDLAAAVPGMQVRVLPAAAKPPRTARGDD
jgi:RND family efflux transporter MFP subunit